VWLLGGAVPQKILTPTDPGSFISGPSEKTTLSMPIFVKNKSQVKKEKNEEYEKRHGNCAWVLPIQGKNGSSEQSKKIEQILERFGCLSSCSKKLSEEVFTAKKTKVLEDFADAETGPRTIAQVRRENKKQELIQGGDLGSAHGQVEGQGIGTGGGGGGDDEIFDNVDMNEGTGTMSATASSGNISDEKYDRKKDGFSLISGSSFLNVPIDCAGIPTSASDLADIESGIESVTIIVLWSCKLGGKIVTGVNTQVSHSILPESTKQGSAKEKEKERSDTARNKVLRGPCDYISLGISHPSSFSISKQNKRADVIVTLEIQSNSNKHLIASLEILDKKTKTSSSEASPSTAVITEKKPKFQSQRGLRWEKKTHYTDIQLFPHESKSFQFYAVISTSGVFDLNRLVLVSYLFLYL
jgi:hypothetical protein